MFKVTDNDIDWLITHANEYRQEWAEIYEALDRYETKPFARPDGRFRYELCLTDEYSSVLFARMWFEESGHDHEFWWDGSEGRYVILTDYAPAHWIEAFDQCRALNAARVKSED